MIDINFAKVEFKDYLKSYDITNPKIDLKITHTYKVVDSAEYIAKGLNLDKEDYDLALFIALLHDIGRFEQIKLFDAYDDRKVDHAELGVKILFDDGLIRKFIKDDSYDEIIKKAIANHNKYKIDEEGMTDRELLHSKIIRDADKLDNFRVKEEESFEALIGKGATEETVANSTISDGIYNTFFEKKLIRKYERETYLDHWVSYIAFIFDFNFKESLKYIKENDYINRSVDRIHYKNPETKERMENIRKFANEYINSFK